MGGYPQYWVIYGSFREYFYKNGIVQDVQNLSEDRMFVRPYLRISPGKIEALKEKSKGDLGYR